MEYQVRGLPMFAASPLPATLLNEILDSPIFANVDAPLLSTLTTLASCYFCQFSAQSKPSTLSSVVHGEPLQQIRLTNRGNKRALTNSEMSTLIPAV